MAQFQSTLKFNKLTPDLRKAFVATHARSSVVWRQAVRVFIETLAAEVSQHQDTGMSYASLFHIAKLVRAKIAPATPKRDSVKGFSSITGTYYKDRIKTRAVGEKLGEKTARIGYGSPINPRFSFTFEIQVFQYLIHEFGLGFNQGDAWNSIGKARSAMNIFLQNKAPFFVPKLSDLFKETGSGIRVPFREA